MRLTFLAASVAGAAGTVAVAGAAAPTVAVSASSSAFRLRGELRGPAGLTLRAAIDDDTATGTLLRVGVELGAAVEGEVTAATGAAGATGAAAVIGTSLTRVGITRRRFCDFCSTRTQTGQSKTERKKKQRKERHR